MIAKGRMMHHHFHLFHHHSNAHITMIHFKNIRTLIISLAFLSGGLSDASAQGIHFMYDLDSALAQAKIENKPVFIDFYTSWCAPCKVMSKEVFPLEKVGSFFNSKFINCKIQCDDKGKGVELGIKYQINAYPTLMFLNPNGELIHTAVGGPSAEGLLDIAKIALNPERNLLSLLKEWDAGNRDTAFVAKYFRALKGAYRNELAKNALQDYFNSLEKKDKTSKRIFELVRTVSVEPFSPIFSYIETNKKDYYRSVGTAELDKYISDSYLWYIKGLIDHTTASRKKYEDAKAKFKAKKYSYYKEFEMFFNIIDISNSNGG